MHDEYDLMIDAIHAVRQLRDFHASGSGGLQPIDDTAAILRVRAIALVSHSAATGGRVNQLALAFADAIEKTYGSKQQKP